MTKQKSSKRRVRPRMEKTDESYAAARRQLLAKAELPVPAEGGEGTGQAAAHAEPQAAADAGVEALKASGIAARTGRDRDDWFALLDEWGARDKPHPDIAQWLREEHGVNGWWAQMITVSYEQARGIRAPGQGRDGRFTVSASKTITVPVERLFGAFADQELRESWLPGEKLDVTTSRPPKSFRAGWGDTGTRVVVGFYPMGEGKSQAGLAHEKIASPEEAKELKRFWTERLAALKTLLES